MFYFDLESMFMYDFICDVCKQRCTCINYLKYQKVVLLAELLVQDVRCHWSGVL